MKNEKNIGFGQTCNVGAFQSSSEWVLLLNQDAIIINFDLNRVKSLTSQEDVAIIGGRTQYRNGDLLPNIGLQPSLFRLLFHWPTLPFRFVGLNIGSLCTNDVTQYETCSSVEWITGSCLLVRRDLFEHQGGFDQKFFCYVEEVEYAQRSKRDGFKIMFEPSIISMHENRAGIGLTSFSVFQTIRGQRILINSNYGGIAAALHIVSASISCIMWGLIASALLWWHPKYISSSWGLVKGGLRSLFQGWGRNAVR